MLFFTRAKDSMEYRQLYSNKIDKNTGAIDDQTIMLSDYYVSGYYPKKIHRIKFRDQGTGKVLAFITNNFHLKANEIEQLYKQKWTIKLLFFKMDKTTFNNKIFLVQSENAVKTQVWIAISVYVLAAISKKEIYAQTIVLRNITNFKYLGFRQNAHKLNVSANSITIFQRTKC